MAKGRINRWLELALTARLAVRGISSARAAAELAERCAYLPAYGPADLEWPATYNALKSLVHAWGAAGDEGVQKYLAVAVTATLDAIDTFPSEHFPALIKLQRQAEAARRGPISTSKEEGRVPWWID